MTTNVKLRGQLVNYAKALGNYIKTVDLATRKYLVMLPRQRLLYKQLLICWFILSLLLILVNLSFFSLLGSFFTSVQPWFVLFLLLLLLFFQLKMIIYCFKYQE